MDNYSIIIFFVNHQQEGARRELKGCRVLPAGVWGVPNFLFFSLAASGGEYKKEEKEVFRGHPEPRSRAAALNNPAQNP
jgi:hypothetical protein